MAQVSSEDYSSQEQNERLTRKHIQTLSFMQEVVAENKELKSKLEELETRLASCTEFHQLAEESKERIKTIQDEYMSKADEIRAMLVEKHKAEIMKCVEDHLNAEQAWNQERETLKEEIERYDKENKRLKDEVLSMEEIKNQRESLILKVNSLTQDLEQVTREVNQLKSVKDNQNGQIDKICQLERSNVEMQHKINELTQRNKELLIRLEKAESMLVEFESKSEKEELVQTLKNKLSKLHKEKCVFEQKEKEYAFIIQELKEENTKLKRDLNDSEKMRRELQQRLDKHLQEMNDCKRKTHVDEKQTFKDFVQLKREMANLRSENEELKQQIKQINSNRSFPSLKDVDQRRGLTRGARKSSSDSNTAGSQWFPAGTRK